MLENTFFSVSDVLRTTSHNPKLLLSYCIFTLNLSVGANRDDIPTIQYHNPYAAKVSNYSLHITHAISLHRTCVHLPVHAVFETAGQENLIVLGRLDLGGNVPQPVPTRCVQKNPALL